LRSKNDGMVLHMISALHLIWVVPLAASIGFLIAAFLAAGGAGK
jgi:hypothetical protein